MGFLNNSTNNIILDAVLTDTGRQFLAKNDGSFAIHKFALGDDEVNYSIISKFGRTIGKEKIEKNTPVLEASTSATHAKKYKLVSVSNPNLIRLPKLVLSGDSNVNVSDNSILLGRNSQKIATVQFEQTISNESYIDVEFRDQVFNVQVPDLLVQILRQTPSYIDTQRASYLLTRSPTENSYGGSTVQFTLSVKSLTDALFQVYGTTANKNRIKSYIKITGLQSGATSYVALILDKSL